MKPKPITVPTLRFPGFAGGWNETSLGDAITSLDAGVSVNSEDTPVTGDELGILKTSCVTKGYFDPSENKRVLDPAEISRLKEPVSKDSIIISRMNTPALVGLSGLVTQDEKSLFLPDRLWAVKVGLGYSPHWIAQLLASEKVRGQLSERASGTSGSMKNITKGDVLSLPVTLPTLPEQRKIAGFLTAVDGRLEQLRQKQALLADYKRGVMQQLFTQALRFKDDLGHAFPDWEEKKLTDVLETVSPRGFQIQSSEILPEGRFKVIDQGKALIAGYCDDASKVMRARPVIVYGDHTTIIKYVDFEFVVGADGTQVLVSKDRINDLKYLYYNLVQNNVTQEGYKRHFSILKGVFMQIPSLPEQTKIAAFLSALDRKIESVAAQLDHTRTFKQGLLQQLFV